MMKRLMFFIALIGVLLVPAQSQAALVTGMLSNFDVQNFTEDPVNDFHILLEGANCADIVNVFTPWGWNYSCQDLPNGDVLISWTSAGYLLPGEMMHFGIEFYGQVDYFVKYAYWTLHGRPILPWISFVNQRWQGSAECWVGDLIDGYTPPVSLDGVMVERDFALMPAALELADLMWDQTMALPWMPGMGPELIPADPEFVSFLQIDNFEMLPAILVRYPVSVPGIEEPIARFTNELIIDPMIMQPQQLFSNFDVYNYTEFCVNDFHISIDGVSCMDFAMPPNNFYIPMGWDVICVDRPGGCEVSWFSVDGSCLMPGEMLHFGLGLMGNPNVRVNAAYWTWNGIPCLPFFNFVWQNWMIDGPMVFDIVQGYNPIVDPNGVTIQRDFALLQEPLPLPELNIVGTSEIDWLPADMEVMLIPPQPEFVLPFIFDPEQTSQANALLITYAVTGSDGIEQLRFYNEALIESIAPPPPIEDLRIEFMGMPEPGLMHFRLEWTPTIMPPHLFSIYALPEPYPVRLPAPFGFSPDSFFDVFFEVDFENPSPPIFFMVTTDPALPTN
jgi:hypothetical protein